MKPVLPSSVVLTSYSTSVPPCTVVGRAGGGVVNCRIDVSIVTFNVGLLTLLAL